MSTGDDNMAARPPEGQDPLPGLAREVFDLVDETVARVSDQEVGERLCRFLDSPAHTAADH